MPEESPGKPAEKNNDVWQLFKEAQQNILYLNKQRLLAVEELNKANREKQLLLDRIQQLEAVKKPTTTAELDVQSLCWELLLRIDSMVLAGMTDTAAASDLRKAVMGNKFSVAHAFCDMRQKSDAELLAELHHFSAGSRKYACLDLTEMHGLREIEVESYSYFNGQLHGNRIWTGFTYFSRASLDYIAKSGKQPDVLHIHNWETAIVGPLFWDIFVTQGLGGTRVLLTCHDFDSQCLEQPDKLALCGLDPARLHRPDRLQDNTKTHLVNVLKGGVVYSNKVAMVSSMYSKGRIIRSFSHGLEPTLAIHKDKLLVTPCGFDNSTWDPSKDKFLPKNYSADDLEGKLICKVSLQQHLGSNQIKDLTDGQGIRNLMK
ncbi:unnamed protein product [Dovyalis caffra]|uniref:starch synthase n=1 Tax=Dovyalis caffra TaxID=77055 RepID=A0AAV1RUE0_9ROSI|nr:unnamed protein product [Dovyalis caffra]